MKKYILCLFVVLAVTINGWADMEQPRLDQCIDIIKKGTFPEKYNAVIYIHSLQLKAIPRLIEEIDMGEKIPTCLAKPNNSCVNIDTLNQFGGTFFAYIIELILARKEIFPNSVSEVSWPLGDACGNYIYWEGRIVSSDGHSLTLEDMKIIKQIYRKWWKKNKHNEIDYLRRNWKNGLRPLARSPYKWL